MNPPTNRRSPWSAAADRIAADEALTDELNRRTRRSDIVVAVLFVVACLVFLVAAVGMVAGW